MSASQGPHEVRAGPAAVERLGFLEAALAASSEGVVIVGAQGQLVLANKAARRILWRELAPAAPIAQQGLAPGLRYPDGRPMPPEEAPLPRALAGEATFDVTLVFTAPDGHDVFISESANPVWGVPGQIIGAVAVFRDITEREQAEQEHERLLREVELERARWYATVESMLDPVTVSDAEGHATYMNDAYFRLLGIPIQVGLAVSEHPRYYRIYRPDGTPFPAEDLPLQRAALRDEQVRDVEIVHRRRDGSEFTAIFSGSPIHDEKGRVIGAVAVGRDVTAQRQAEAERERLLAEVKRRAAELDATLNSITSGLVILGPGDQLLRMNGAAERILGVTTERWASLPPAERSGIIRAETPEGRPLPLQETPRHRALRGETTLDFHMVLRRPDGSRRDVLTSSGPIQDEEGHIIGAVANWADITPLVELQNERERLLAQVEALLVAEHLAREEAQAALRLRDEFLSTAAHELKTPLTSLRGQAELTMQRIAQGRIRDVQQVRSALQVIDRQVDRLTTLVAQVLDFSSIESGELQLERQWVDLVPLARRMVETMQAGATRHALSLQAPEWLRAFVDPLRLEEVLYNLLDNAIRYSPRGGPVLVDLSAPNADTVRIAVRDYGIGVPPEQRERLFTRFFQAARRPAGGLGLGLYISRRIVELHGGRIWAEFPEDGGSRFVAEVPRSAAGTEGTKGTDGTEGASVQEHSSYEG